MDRRRFITAAGTAAGTATALGLAGCGGGDGSSAPPPTGPDWVALSASVQGTVLRPGSLAYGSAAPVFNMLFDATAPQAVAQCASAADVAATLAFARQNQRAVVPRSGGHGYTGNSATTGIVIDVGPMNAIVVDAAAGAATIGAGAKLVDVYDQLSAQCVCIPSGSCPTIGIAGIAQGGGVGVVDRAYGLTCDRLVSAQVVLADGSIVDCDAATHPDLFWALRGGGGNFGVVTSLTFATFATSDQRPHDILRGLRLGGRRRGVRRLAGVAPDGARHAVGRSRAGHRCQRAGDRGLGRVHRWPSDFAPLWSQFLAAAGVAPSAMPQIATQPFHDVMLASCGSLSVSQCHLAGETSDGEIGRTAFVASSDFFDAALLQAMEALQSQGPYAAILDLMGGAIAQVAPTDTSSTATPCSARSTARRDRPA